MDSILESIKCVNCRNLLVSPVFLPCGHKICKKHTSDTKDAVLICQKCGIRHQIPANGSFPQIEAFAQIIEAQIASLDLGQEHNDAKQSCLQLDELLTKIEHILSEPFNFTHDAINYLKNVVQVKGDEAKSEIEQTMSRMLTKLDEYKDENKRRLKNDDYLTKSEAFALEKEAKRDEMRKWRAMLNEIRINNENEWRRIKSECEKSIEHFQIKLARFKSDFLFPKRLQEIQTEIEQKFGKFNTDPGFDSE
jgi:transcription elongation factor Elf1